MIGISVSKQSGPGTAKADYPTLEFHSEDERRCLHRLILWYRRRRQILADVQQDQNLELAESKRK